MQNFKEQLFYRSPSLVASKKTQFSKSIIPFIPILSGIKVSQYSSVTKYWNKYKVIMNLTSKTIKKNKEAHFQQNKFFSQKSNLLLSPNLYLLSGTISETPNEEILRKLQKLLILDLFTYFWAKPKTDTFTHFRKS